MSTNLRHWNLFTTGTSKAFHLYLTTRSIMLKMSTHTIRGMLPKTISTSLDLEPTWESRQLVLWQQISGRIFLPTSKN